MSCQKPLPYSGLTGQAMQQLDVLAATNTRQAVHAHILFKLNLQGAAAVHGGL